MYKFTVDLLNVTCDLRFLLPGDRGDGPDGGERGIQRHPQRSRQRQGQGTTHHLLY